MEEEVGGKNVSAQYKDYTPHTKTPSLNNFVTQNLLVSHAKIR